jgi:hypothetical protein
VHCVLTGPLWAQRCSSASLLFISSFFHISPL